MNKLKLEIDECWQRMYTFMDENPGAIEELFSGIKITGPQPMLNPTKIESEKETDG